MYPGITVHYITLSDADISARPLLEANAGKYLVDILSASAEQANALHAAGLIADQSNITVPDGYPPTAVGKWWVLSGFNPGLIAWNTDLVPASQAPTDWQSLLDPMWKGKVAIDSANVDLIEGLVSKFGAAGARTYVTNLVVNNAALIRSGDTNMLNLMVAGEFPIVAGALGTHVDSLLAKGAHIAWVAPDPSPGTVTVDMIAAHATHPYAAALFLSWLYSVPGATLDASIGRLPLNPNAKIADPNMAQFLVAGSVPNTRLFLLNPDSVGALQGPANSIIDQIITPRYVP
jgi:iron(III) transport system substrate-binding protein